MNRSALVLSLAVAGCGLTGRYMPKDIKGSTPLAVHNASGVDLCNFVLAPPGKNYADYNLLTTHMQSSASQMKPDEKSTFNVKPGTYQLYILSCQQGFQFERQINIAGPTYIGIGEARPSGVPSGYAVISTMSSGDESCSTEGSPVDENGVGSDGRPCCSGRHHWDESSSSQVCDPQ